MGKRIIIASIVFALGIVMQGASSASLSYLFEGARPMAMGGAFVAVVDDPNAIFYNPAGLGFLKKAEISTSFAQLLRDANYYKIAFYYSLGDYGTMAIGGDQVNLEPFPITSINENGTPEIVGTGSFTNRILLLSFSTRISEDLSIGINLKKYDEYFEGVSFSGSGIGNTIGLLYKPIKWLSLGVNLEDYLNGKCVFEDSGNSIEQKIPTSLLLGFSARPINNLIVAGDVIKNDLARDDSNNLLFKGGAEINIYDWMFLRLGYQKSNYEVNSQVASIKTAGLGFVLLNSIKMDYAYTWTRYVQVVGDRESHYLSLGTKF